jgi:hypothetical protein
VAFADYRNYADRQLAGPSNNRVTAFMVSDIEFYGLSEVVNLGRIGKAKHELTRG